MIESPDLHDAVDHLYRVFSLYPLHDHIDGCPCCVSPSDQVTIRAKPLRSLTTNDLGRYAGKALTTWGTLADFKHFLPRLLELVITDPVFNEAIMARKLHLAQWMQWPPHERACIDRYLNTLWHVLLTWDDLEAYGRPMDDWLTFIGAIVDDLTPFLCRWQDSSTFAAWYHLAVFLYENYEMLMNKNALRSIWWGTRPDQMHQVVQWLYSPELQDKMEHAFFSYEAEPNAKQLALAADLLCFLRS